MALATRAGPRTVEQDVHLTGARRDFTVPLDLRLATPFDRRTVMAPDAFVPYGRTAIYGQLGTAPERPGAGAARAVGTVLGADPLRIVPPCHRVIGSNGGMHGYAGGLAAKRFPARLECAKPSRPTPHR